MGAPRAGVPRGSGTEPAAQELDPRRHRAKRVYLAPTQRLTSTCGYQQLTSTPIAVMRELARTQCQPPSGAAFAEPGAGLGLVLVWATRGSHHGGERFQQRSDAQAGLDRLVH